MTTRLVPVLLLVLAGACVRDEKAQLPPATGDDAPAGPALPPLPPAADAKTAGETTHRFVGTTYADDKVSVAAEGSGTLAEVTVDIGDKVKKGQVLFRLKAQNARIGVKRSRAGLDAARTSLANAKRELARMKELSNAGAVSPAALDTAQTNFDAAMIQVEQAELGVTDTQTSLADRTVRSPIDGIVTERFKHPGEAVTSMPPTIVLELQNQAELELRLRVPEALMRSVEPGTSMRARFPALDVEHDVKVQRLGAEVDPRTRTIEVVCLLPNKDLRLKPGMSADVVLAGVEGSTHAAVKREESSP
jgi:membrane fusion protein, multidrug efflux system